MTQDEIIDMARQAGLHIATDVNWMPIIGIEYAETFTQLVAAKEREAAIKIIKETSFSNWFQADLVEAIRARGEQA